MPFAFEHLNLRFNPFGELPADERAQLAVVNVEHLADKLKNPGTAIQFIAPQGRGKSTHLLALHQCLNQYPNHYRYYKASADDTINVIPSDLVFIDSIDLLQKNERKKIFPLVNSLAFTSHEDLTPELKSQNFEIVSIPISCTDTPTLANVFKQRIQHARRSQAPIPTIADESVTRLIKLYNDDIRAMEYHLYDTFQSLTDINDVKV
jgi:hypothetical protein